MLLFSEAIPFVVIVYKAAAKKSLSISKKINFIPWMLLYLASSVLNLANLVYDWHILCLAIFKNMKMATHLEATLMNFS